MMIGDYIADDDSGLEIDADTIENYDDPNILKIDPEKLHINLKVSTIRLFFAFQFHSFS